MTISISQYERVARRLFPGAKLHNRQRLAGGVSADVYRLDLVLADEQHRSVVLRKHGSSYDGHPVALEYQLLDVLHRHDIPVPKPLLADSSGQLLEHPFLVMSFVPGSTGIPAGSAETCIQRAAELLVDIHDTSTSGLPALPARLNPLPEVFDYLPPGREWQPLVGFLADLDDTGYRGSPKLLHGDYWPENIIWENGSISAVLDWEDAATGDPLSDLACSRLEIRYLFGITGMQCFTRAYQTRNQVSQERLALWQIYVAAAAYHFMGQWGLPKEREAHMRHVALASIQEAGETLMAGVELV